MITKADAIRLGEKGGTLYHRTARNSDKSPVRARSNGKCQVWKTRPDDWSLPVVYGLRGYFRLTHLESETWCLTEQEALAPVGSGHTTAA